MVARKVHPRIITPSSSPSSSSVVIMDEAVVPPASPSKMRKSENLLQIRPYKHQVGGHVGIFAVNGYIFKPYNQNEAEFYNRMPAQLRPLTAENCFKVEIEPSENSEVFDVHVSDMGPESSFDAKHSNISLEHCEDSDSDDMYRDVCSGMPQAVNPWAFQCQVRSFQEGPSVGPFLVLENMTSTYINPCIVDLKLGCRQYGDDATEAKKESQRKKCAKTTSKELGLRICGMQYYDAASATYQCVNKYYGRSLDKNGFQKLIAKFFKDFNGRIRESVCSQLITRLEEIRDTLKGIDGLRLYGASLLIVFEGSSFVDEPKLDAKLIDFANATYDGLSGQHHESVDAGTIFGLDNLIQVISKLVAKR